MLLISPDILDIARKLLTQQATTSVEHLYAIAADGRTYERSGTANSVTADLALEARYDEVGAGIIYHHSHPDDRALSPSDLELIARPGVATIWAHSPSGVSYGATTKPGIDKCKYANALESLNGHLCNQIIPYTVTPLDDASFEAFRDFAVMNVLEMRGWIDCYLSWSDKSRRAILANFGGFHELQVYLYAITNSA